MKKLLHILLLFIIWIPGVSQVYNMGNLGTISDACGGLFYDSQGPNAQYQNNEFSTVTFCAPAGQAITFTFTDFRLEAGFDFLDIYNGPTTASPLLGSYTGNLGPGVISSTIGGCLTFQFSSDGTTRRRGWEAAISCGDLPPPTNNGDSCPNSTPFCTGSTYTFNNNINVPSLGSIDCLSSSPNPVWYYFEIDNPGDLTIDIAQYDVFDFPIDVDFLLWGPFTDLPEGCTEIQNSTAPVVDCSFSGSAFEQAIITGAQTGEVYILLLTNYENDQGYITFNSSSSSTATTNCDILCSITALSATPSACDPTTNTYEISGELTVTNPPESGILTFTSSCGGTTTVSAPFGSQISYTISGINATGGSCNVVATFSADPTCTITESYTAPAACASVSLNCPDYANASTSPATACSNQTYYLDVANTACAGQIYFNVAGNYGSDWGDEISWLVTSNLSGNIVASGTGNLSGSNFSSPFGPINPLVDGTIFTLEVLDAAGDGFDGVNGQIYVTQGSNTIGGPIAGEIGFGSSSIFGANISISPATITVTTPAGNVVQTVQNCNDFRVPISIENPNFCNTISATLPWTVTCNSTGATLASGSNTLTVYPTLPSSSNDVVSIQYNTSTCDWEVTGNNDCDAGDIGTIFTISPDPASLTNTACTGGNQVFDVTYIGVGGGPNCCLTGGTLIPIQINDPYVHGSYVLASSPFGGINNAAYLNIPPNSVGGNATSLQLDINMTGFCMDPAGPNAGADLSYWVTVIVDGQIVSDVNTIDPGPSNYSQSINLANIPGGFNSSMDIEVYIYPNLFTSPNGAVFQTYNPTATCASLGNGIWTASSIIANLAVTFEEFEPTAATCLYPTNAAFSCCSPTTVSNVSSTICSGGSTSAVTTWQNAVAAANPSCVVYSSVLPIAGTTAPNNTLPNGINGTATPIVQTVSAYAYCDADGSSTINTGDTYTLISTYNLTVNPTATAGSNGSTTICNTGSPVNLFSLLGGTPSTSGTWSGPSALSGGQLGTFNPASNTAGIYTYTVAGTSPCPNSSATVTVTLSSTPSASINYGGSPFCKSISTPQSVSLSGTTGGSYSAAPAGLSINTSTGAITPSSSTAGTYTVTYTVAAAGGCLGTTATASVEIVAVPDVATNLPSYSTCSGPTLATAGGYTINITSTTSGASFNWTGSDGNSGTGTPINYPIANNTCSDQTVTFTITSTINGCSSVPINRVLTLRPKPLATFTVSPNPICLGNSATVTFTGTSCPGSAYNWTWPAGVNVLSGSGAGPYTISFNSAGLYNIRHQIVGPASIGSCTSPLVTVPVTVIDPANAGTSATTSICNTGSPVNLFSLLGGTPSTSGTWSGPSALSGGQLGTFNPASNTAGIYTYTVAGTSPCPDATSTVTVTLNTAPSASITYSGSPFCKNLVGTQAVSLTGTTGGTFSSSPSGLSINTSTGTITASSSTPGTYTLTYTIAAVGVCAAFSTTTTVVITSAPSTPSLTPALPCAGEVANFTASGGSWYSFTVNGVELQAPSVDNTYTSAILAAGDQVCVQSYPTPPFVFNGQISEPEWGAPLATSAGGPTSSFGALNNLDALYLKNMSGNLYGALAGQTENGSNNRFLLFIDCIPGGFNSLSSWISRSEAPYYSTENLSNSISFDPGFSPDYILAMNQAFGSGFFDLYNMQTNVNLFLGQTGSSEPLGYQNNGGSGNFTKGFEFAISLDKLGNPSGSIQVFAMLVNDPGFSNPTFVSNQFLTPAGPFENSYGNAAISFGSATPNPISFALSADCSSETCVTVTAPVTPSFSVILPFCEGSLAPSLPSTSTNGISGTWNPSVISNSAGNTYNFTPTAGQCADPTSITTTVLPKPSTTSIYHD